MLQKTKEIAYAWEQETQIFSRTVLEKIRTPFTRGGFCGILLLGNAFQENFWKRISCWASILWRRGSYDVMAAANQLKPIRESLGLSQEGVARRTRSLSSRTIKNAEEGNRVTYDTATQILEAINTILSEAGRPTITLDELGLTLY